MSQDQLWAYFQNDDIASFAGAKVRLDYLLTRSQPYNSGVKASTLLNIGCGSGYLERRAAERGWRTMSVDPDRKSIDRLAVQGIDAHCGVIESLPLDSNSVAVVVCTEVLEHLSPDQMESGLIEINRVLKPSGMLIGTVPYRENLKEQEVFCPHCNALFHRWGHQQSFDEKKMERVLAAHFKVREIGPKYFPQWNTNWKGKALNSAILALSLVGSHGKSSNLFFAAIKSN